MEGISKRLPKEAHTAKLRCLIAVLFISSVILIGRQLTANHTTKIDFCFTNINFQSRFNADYPAQDAVWQPVAGVCHKFYVYSAYYESRGSLNRTVRIIGATKLFPKPSVFCTFWMNRTSGATVRAKIETIKEHHYLVYTACFITCLYPFKDVPHSVSITTDRRTFANRLLVIDGTMRAKLWNGGNRSIGICVKPLHNNYDKITELVQFLELNRILGMDHVTFYNSSISPTTDCVLRTYRDEGRVSVFPWNDQFKSQVEIRTENLFAALNDCLYRNMYNFSYLAFLDMDEYIMPVHHVTIQQLISQLTSRDLKLEGSYLFRNGFFYLQWPDDPMFADDPYARRLTTLMKSRRLKTLHPHKRRSKLIVQPRSVVMVGNHHVWKFIKGRRNKNVHETDAILNHYRICEYGGDDCVKNDSVVDRTAFRYRRQLVAAVENRWKQLQGLCEVGDIGDIRYQRSEANKVNYNFHKLGILNQIGSWLFKLVVRE